MKKFAIAISLVLFASLALSAQTNATAQWNQPNVLADAQSYTYTLKIDTAAPVTLTATCITINSVVQCSAPITGWNGAVTHTLVLTASNSSGQSASGTFNTAPGPGVPTGAKIIVIIIGDNNE